MYGISEEDVSLAMSSPDHVDTLGARMTVLRRFPDKFSGYPLKVVYESITGEPLIVTAYPLKRSSKR